MTITRSYASITRGVDVLDGDVIEERLMKGLPVKGFWGKFVRNGLDVLEGELTSVRYCPNRKASVCTG